MFLRSVPVRDDRLKTSTIGGAHIDDDILAHPPNSHLPTPEGIRRALNGTASLRLIAAVRSMIMELPGSTLLGHSAFALGMALLPHLEGLFQASAWYDGSTSTAMVKEI